MVTPRRRKRNKKKVVVAADEEYVQETVGQKELMAVIEEGEWMTLTVDSGASENVIGRDMAPQSPTRPSAGSRAGVKYMAANGSIMPNRGEKDVKVVTEEGDHCTLRMQVTDVQKALVSVSKICDAGHEVTFTKDGGEIKHIQSGQTTKFKRADDVYRLNVKLNTVFSRREM